MAPTHRKATRPENVLVEMNCADGSRMTVVTTDAASVVFLSAAAEAELLAAIQEANAGRTVAADDVLRRLPER